MARLIYLLDTNVISERIKAEPDPRVDSRFRKHFAHLATAATVWHELLFGVESIPSSRRQNALREYLETAVLAEIPILPYDEKAAQWHALERARLKIRGLTPSFSDGQVAAIAATNELTLVTRNVTDFRSFSGLRVENWFLPARATRQA